MVSHFSTNANNYQADDWFGKWPLLAIIHSSHESIQYSYYFLVLFSRSVRYGKGDFLYLSVLVITGLNSFWIFVDPCLVLIIGGGAVLTENQLLYLWFFTDLRAKFPHSFTLLSFRLSHSRVSKALV